MLIDGRNYRINVLMLCMRDEVHVTLPALRALLRDVEPGVIVSVLLNGGESEELARLAQESPGLRYHAAPRNLGVAGGRNRLLGTDECKDSDIVMIIDNDVIPPTDYVRNLASFLVRQDDAGIVGAAVADVKAFPGLRDSTTTPIGALSCADVRSIVLDGLVPDRLYHLGVSRDYMYAYFSVAPKFHGALESLGIFGLLARAFGIHADVNPMLKGNPKYLEMIRRGADRFEVSNVAGCSQAFRRRLVDEIGGLDDRFSPYGFEDAEFCIRAMRAGYRNYVDTGTWLWHGTDDRHRQRNQDDMLVNTYRCRTILGASVFGSVERLRRVLLRQIWLTYLLDFPHPRRAPRMLRLRLAGLRKGLAQLAAGDPPAGAALPLKPPC